MQAVKFDAMAYDTVRYFEDVPIQLTETTIPDILYKVYRYVILVDHFSNELTLFENVADQDVESGLERLEKIIYSNRFSTFSFKSTDKE